MCTTMESFQLQQLSTDADATTPSSSTLTRSPTRASPTRSPLSRRSRGAGFSRAQSSRILLSNSLLTDNDKNNDPPLRRMHRQASTRVMRREISQRRLNYNLKKDADDDEKDDDGKPLLKTFRSSTSEATTKSSRTKSSLRNSGSSGKKSHHSSEQKKDKSGSSSNEASTTTTTTTASARRISSSGGRGGGRGGMHRQSSLRMVRGDVSQRRLSLNSSEAYLKEQTAVQQETRKHDELSSSHGRGTLQRHLSCNNSHGSNRKALVGNQQEDNATNEYGYGDGSPASGNVGAHAGPDLSRTAASTADDGAAAGKTTNLRTIPRRNSLGRAAASANSGAAQRSMQAEIQATSFPAPKRPSQSLEEQNEQQKEEQRGKEEEEKEKTASKTKVSVGQFLDKNNKNLNDDDDDDEEDCAKRNRIPSDLKSHFTAASDESDATENTMYEKGMYMVFDPVKGATRTSLDPNKPKVATSNLLGSITNESDDDDDDDDDDDFGKPSTGDDNNNKSSTLAEPSMHDDDDDDVKDFPTIAKTDEHEFVANFDNVGAPTNLSRQSSATSNGSQQQVRVTKLNKPMTSMTNCPVETSNKKLGKWLKTPHLPQLGSNSNNNNNSGPGVGLKTMAQIVHLPSAGAGVVKHGVNSIWTGAKNAVGSIHVGVGGATPMARMAEDDDDDSSIQ